MGIDVGEKRVGISLSDGIGLLAHPFATFDRAKGVAEKAVIKLAKQREIDTLIVGLPLLENGEKGSQCDDVENFCRRIQKRAELRIIFVDEHLSSEEAKQRLKIGASAKRIDRQKGVIDAVSASIILQSYLDELKQRRDE